MTPWKQRLDLLGSILGVLGIVLSIFAISMRLTLGGGNPADVIIAPRNVLLLGITAMVAGCWCKLTAR